MIDVATAAGLIARGGVIAYPTEAVWGLGCDPRNEAAVMRLLAIKGRPVEKGLILIASHEDQLAPFIDFNQLEEARRSAVRATWPGPHTWVVPASAAAPRWITGAHAGIAIRVSAHDAVVALCDAYGGAIVSTSANASGEPPPRSPQDIDAGLLRQLDGCLAGVTGGRAAPSSIREARSGEVLRA